MAKGLTEATKETDGSEAGVPLREEQGLSRSPENPVESVKNRRTEKEAALNFKVTEAETLYRDAKPGAAKEEAGGCWRGG